MSHDHATAQPKTAELAKVPQILPILVENGSITADQQGQLVADKDNSAYKGKFFGETAVAKGFVTQDQVDAGTKGAIFTHCQSCCR